MLNGSTLPVLYDWILVCPVPQWFVRIFSSMMTMRADTGRDALQPYGRILRRTVYGHCTLTVRTVHCTYCTYSGPQSAVRYSCTVIYELRSHATSVTCAVRSLRIAEQLLRTAVLSPVDPGLMKSQNLKKKLPRRLILHYHRLGWIRLGYGEITEELIEECPLTSDHLESLHFCAHQY